MVACFLEFVGRDYRPPAATAASLARGFQPGVGALADQVTLELGERAEDVEDQHPAWRGRVDLFGQRPEPDVARGELADFLDQVAHRAAKPVELPNDQRIACAEIGQRLGQARPIGLRTRGVILKDALAAGVAQCIMLQPQLLVTG